MIEIKNTVIKINNAFNRFINKLDTDEKRINSLSINRGFQTEMQREK